MGSMDALPIGGYYKQPRSAYPGWECGRPRVFVYGEILDIDYHNYFISIEQHFDDNSIPVANPLKVISNVAIRRKNSNIHFYQLKVGDVGGFIVNKNGEVWGIVVS